MSNIIDQRVVEMRFDNKNFEENVSTSMGTLSKLKTSLNLSESVKNITDLGKAAGSISMEGLANGVEIVKMKFSALDVIAITALRRITDSAIDTGKKMISALTIDPIKTGFQEYETQINAVQTILANTSSKGTTLKEVNQALDTLNTYADKTIYNFTEMTRNIGTFTAAGIELDTATTAIQGIANLAAVSGSTSQQASTAMYQLSQALASGTVKLMDWNSVVNAGMGGQVFQDALKETARAHGIAIDEMIEDEGSFRETLSKGWLSSEILTETLTKFTLATEDMSEAQIQANREMLKSQGYTDEQIEKIFELGNTATNAATKVKTFTQLWDTLKEAAQSGWTQTWEYVVGDFEEAKASLTAISDTFGELIGQSSEARNEIVKFWHDNGGRDAMINAITNSFHALMDIVKPIGEAFREVFPAMTGQQLVALSKRIEEVTKKFKMSEETINNIKATFKGFFSLLDIGKQAFSAIVRTIMPMTNLLDGMGSSILSTTASFGTYVTNLADTLRANDTFYKALQKLSEVFTNVSGYIQIAFNKIKEVFVGFKSIDTSPIDGISNKMTVRFQPLVKIWEMMGAAAAKIGEIVVKIAPVFAKLASVVGKGMHDFASAIATNIENMNFSTLFDILNGGIFAAIGLGIKKFIDSLSGITENAGGILESVQGIFGGVEDCLKSFQSNLKAKTLMTIATAVALLAASIVALTLVDSEKLSGALITITSLFGELVGAMAIMTKLGEGSGFKNVQRVNGTLIAMSASLLLMAFALKEVASIEIGQLITGVIGLGALCVMMVNVADLLSDSSRKVAKGAGGLILFGIAVNLMIAPIKQLAAMDLGSLAKGLISLGALMTELVIFIQLVDGKSSGIGNGIGLIALASSMLIFASAIDKLGAIDDQRIMKGVIAMGVVLTEIALFTQVTGNAKHVLTTASAMLVLGAAMEVFASVIDKLGSMELASLVQGLVGLSGALTIISIAAAAMQGTLGSAASLFVMATALTMLIIPLKVLSTMSLAELGIAMLGLAGTLAILGGAAALLQPLIPAMLALSGAVALFGIGVAATAAGVLMLSVALTTLAGSGAAVAASLVTIVAAISGVIPLIIAAIGRGIAAFIQAIAGSASALIQAAVTVIMSVLDGILQVAPRLITVISTIISLICMTIISDAPKIVEAGFVLLTSLLRGIAQNIGEIVILAGEIIVGFINGLSEKLPDIIQAGVDLIVAFIDGLANSLVENTVRLRDAFINLMTSVLKAILAFWGIASPSTKFAEIGRYLIEGLIKGISSMVAKAISAIKDVGTKMIAGIKTKVDEFKQIGRNMVDGLVSGVKEFAHKAVDAVKGVANSAIEGAKNLLGIHSPSRVFAEFGRFVDLGFAQGIAEYAGRVGKAITNMAEDTVNTMADAILDISSLLDSDVDTSPVITPVLDLTEIQNGSERLNSLLSNGIGNAYVNAAYVGGTLNGNRSVVSEVAPSQTETNRTVMNFTQNNYSPKSLSRTEIYRQTRNQFAQAKGLVQGT